VGAGIAGEFMGWLAGGIVSVFLGGWFALLAWLLGNGKPRSIKRWRQASLVISPQGLALVQGDMQGELRWDEVRDVRIRRRDRSSFELSSGTAGPGILLRVEGATVSIADLYDRPLVIIHQNILQYWR
jgi:hypothetical protein